MTTVVCPPTPAGLALGKVLRMFGSVPDRRSLEAAFDISFLAEVGITPLQELFEAVGPATLAAVTSQTPQVLTARLRAEGGEPARLQLVVGSAAPSRITGMVVHPEADRAGVPFDTLQPPPATIHLDTLDGVPGDVVAGILAEVCAAKAVTGLSATVVQRGRVAFHASVGWAGLEPMRPVEARSVFRAYALAKPVTAIAVLQLWEQQQFDLDDPINEHLRSMRVDGPGRAITVRDLLSHRSGLGAAGSELLWAVHAPRPVEVLGPVIEAPDRPGGIVYSNAGYGILTQLVEDLTGRPYEEHALDHVLAPLAMVSSELRRSDPPGDRFAEGHDVVFGEAWRADTTVASLLGAGGLFTTAPDLAALGLAIIGDGANGSGRVLSAGSMRMATTPVTQGAPVGLGVFLTEACHVPAVWHSGGGHGFSSVLIASPTTGAAVALVANTSGRTGDDGGLEADALGMLEAVITGVG